MQNYLLSIGCTGMGDIGVIGHAASTVYEPFYLRVLSNADIPFRNNRQLRWLTIRIDGVVDIGRHSPGINHNAGIVGNVYSGILT